MNKPEDGGESIQFPTQSLVTVVLVMLWESFILTYPGMSLIMPISKHCFFLPSARKQETCIWASMRLQTLWRTVAGICKSLDPSLLPREQGLTNPI